MISESADALKQVCQLQRKSNRFIRRSKDVTKYNNHLENENLQLKKELKEQLPVLTANLEKFKHNLLLANDALPIKVIGKEQDDKLDGHYICGR